MKRLAAVACLSACLPSGRQLAHGPARAAYARPQAVFQHYDGLTGDLLYAETTQAAR